MVTARELTISFDRTLPWEVDGGDRERTADFEVRCIPRAIRICRPAGDSDSAHGDLTGGAS
jgi:diacylglycerol kinase family enzyme